MSRRNVAKHSEETKRRALKRVAEKVPEADICKMFRIGKSTLDKWKRQERKK